MNLSASDKRTINMNSALCKYSGLTPLRSEQATNMPTIALATSMLLANIAITEPK